jgi:hypothetical protein
MKYLVALVSVLFVFGIWTYSAPMAKEAQYTGAKSCSKCHKKDKEGEQFPIWEKSRHAETYKLLGEPKAKEAAQKVGVSGDPQKAEACLICHTTGYGAPESAFSKKFDIAEGVQCEACHGAGSEYDTKKIMEAIGKERGPDRKGVSATAKKVGLVIPDENSCKTCHAAERTHNGKTYKNPTNKAFDYKKMFDEIKHPVPEK